MAETCLTVDQLPLRSLQGSCSAFLRMLPVQDAATVNAVTKASKETRPRSAYSLFQRESGPQILAKHKGVSLGDRSKILAAAWKKVSEAEKARQAWPGKQNCLVSSCQHKNSLPQTIPLAFLPVLPATWGIY